MIHSCVFVQFVLLFSFVSQGINHHLYCGVLAYKQILKITHFIGQFRNILRSKYNDNFKINLTQAEKFIGLFCIIIPIKSYTSLILSSPNLSPRKLRRKKPLTSRQNRFLGRQNNSSLYISIPSSNLQCLPPSDPRNLCA